jgi:hypothetical protein
MTENIVPFDRDKQLIERIEQLMADPPEGSVVLEFTPGVCRHVLKEWHGKHNRGAKTAAIQRYRGIMENDGWRLNGSTIVFTDQNLLGDGQNRIMACVRAEKAFKTHTIFGIDHLFFDTIDQGRVRNPDDILHIAGVANSRPVALAVRWAELFATNKATRRTVFTPSEILGLYRMKHKAVEDFLPEGRRIRTVNQQPIGLVMALLYTFDKVDSDFAADFSGAWQSGSFPAPFQGIGKMQAELARLKNVQSGRIHEVVRAAMIINAWNAARDGRKGRSIGWDPSKPFPVIR